MSVRQKPQFSGICGIFIHLILVGAVAGSLIALLFTPVLVLLNISMLTDTKNVLMIGLVIIGSLINLLSGLAVLDGKKWGVIGLVIGMTVLINFNDVFNVGGVELLRILLATGLTFAFFVALLFAPYWPQFE